MLCSGGFASASYYTVGRVQQQCDVSLAPLTTLRIGGPAAQLVEARSTEELTEAVRDADATDMPVLLMGGGSNVVLSDEGWPGRVVLIRSRGASVQRDGESIIVRVVAGEPWDEFVARCVAEGWSGVECLSGVPGLAGAVPVQNVGAYGQEIAHHVESVSVWDRHQKQQRELSPAECEFTYRHSIFKHSQRFVVLSVTLRLAATPISQPLQFPELAKALGLSVGDSAELSAVREAVLGLRHRKGMVLDPADHDTWSVGSFFTNPIIQPSEFATFRTRLDKQSDFPHWPVEDGSVKLSAAWLIENAGYHKGYRPSPDSRVGLSSKHVLALTNRGNARAAEIINLARMIRDSVRVRYGITLSPEPLLIGLTL